VLWCGSSVNRNTFDYGLHLIIIFTYHHYLCTLITTFAVGLCSRWVSDGRDLAVQNHVMMMTVMKATSAGWQLGVLVIKSHGDQDHCAQGSGCWLLLPLALMLAHGQGLVGELSLLVMPRVCWIGAMAVFAHLRFISPCVTICVRGETGFTVYVTLHAFWIQVPCFPPVPCL